MDTSKHTLNTLFEQLGLAADGASMEQFMRQHSPLPPEVMLADADFWSTGQSQFLREGLEDDSDWAEAIDELNALLRY
jgi:hypothetical protein